MSFVIPCERPDFRHLEFVLRQCSGLVCAEDIHGPRLVDGGKTRWQCANPCKRAGAHLGGQGESCGKRHRYRGQNRGENERDNRVAWNGDADGVSCEPNNEHPIKRRGYARREIQPVAANSALGQSAARPIRPTTAMDCASFSSSAEPCRSYPTTQLESGFIHSIASSIASAT